MGLTERILDVRPTKVRENLTKFPPRVLANYIIYKLVKGAVPLLTTELDAITWPFEKLTTGISKKPPRWETCVQYLQMSTTLKIAVGAMYVKAFTSPADKTAVEDIVKNLVGEFKEMLKDLEAWMDPKTRAEAEKKVDKMGRTVDYPKEFLDDDLIIQYYSDLNMKKNDSFLLKALKMSQFTRKKSAGELR